MNTENTRMEGRLPGTPRDSTLQSRSEEKDEGNQQAELEELKAYLDALRAILEFKKRQLFYARQNLAIQEWSKYWSKA